MLAFSLSSSEGSQSRVPSAASVMLVPSPCVLVFVYNRSAWARQTVVSLAPIAEAVRKLGVVAPLYRVPEEPEQLPGPEISLPSPYPQGWASRPVKKEMQLERYRESPCRHRRLQSSPGRGFASEGRGFEPH